MLDRTRRPGSSRRRHRPAGLRAGTALVGLLGLVALGAPWLATDAPWIRSGPDGWSFPAWLGGGEEPGRTLVPAPVPYRPEQFDLQGTLSPPSRKHWMGTDSLGRDLAARVIHGTRVSLSVGMLATTCALLIGLPLGAIAGYVRGWPDAFVSRAIEAVLCIPLLLLVLSLLAVAPAAIAALPDASRIALVLGLTGWVPIARYLRGEVMRVGEAEMVLAARAVGAGHLRILTRHVLPGSLAPVLVTAAFSVGSAIALEATLSFLGLGVQPPVPTWGGLLAEAREHVSRGWWLAAFPGLALFLAVLGCNLIGEGLRDLLDPRRRGRGPARGVGPA